MTSYLRPSSSGRRPMTGRELKRLRLKRSAIISRQRLSRNADHTESIRREIENDNEAAFNGQSRQCAAENVYRDLLVEEIYEEIDKYGFLVFEDNESSGTEGSFGTAATANSSSVDQDHELIVTTTLPGPTPSRSVESDNIVEGGEYSGRDNDNEIDTRLVHVVTNMDTSATSSRQIHVEKFEDDVKKFEQLLKLYEDQRIQRSLAAEIEHGTTTDMESCIHDTTSVYTSTSLDTFGFKIGDHIFDEKSSDHPTMPLGAHEVASVSSGSTLSNTFQFLMEQRTPTAVETARALVDEGNISSSKDPTSPFSKSKKSSDPLRKVMSSASSIDSHGFPDDESAGAPLLTSVTKFPSHNDALFTARHDFENREEQEHENKTSAESRGEFLNKQRLTSATRTMQNTESSVMLSKARRLRALRLRAAANGGKGEYPNTRVEPDHYFRSMEEEEKEEAKDWSDASECQGHSGQIIRVQSSNGRGIPCQSVVSEISVVSERLLSKMDELSVLCSSLCESEVEYHKRMEYKEIEAPGAKEPDLYFDASIKTPPRCYLDPKIKARLKQEREISVFRDPSSNKSKWDDMSSIGLVGVETIYKRSKPPKNIPRENHTTSITMDPSDIRSRQKDSIKDEEKEEKIGRKSLFRRILCLMDDIEESDEEQSQESPTFSTLWADGPSNAKKECPKKPLKDTPELKINPTFSTVSSEDVDDFSSYYTGNSAEDIKDLEKHVNRPKDKPLQSPQSQPQSLRTSILAFSKSHRQKGRIYSC